MNQLNKLKIYGYIESLNWATKISSNMISFALIALIPSFGSKGVAISAFLMLGISSLLELPTSYWADRSGWHKAIIAGFVFKFLSTIAILFSIYFAINNKIHEMWALIVFESILDAIANSILSGTYQSFYLHWYSNGSKGDQEPLFLSSFKYGFFIRITIPMSAIGLGTLFVTQENISTGSNLILLPIFYLLILRLANLFVNTSISLKNRGLQFEKAEVSQLDSQVMESILKAIPEFLVFSFFRFCQISTVMVIVNEAYKYILSASGSYSRSWAIGLVTGFGLHILNLVVSRYFYPKVKIGFDYFNLVKKLILLVLCSSLVSLLIFVIDTDSKGKVFCLYFLSLVCIFTSQFGIYAIQSNINKLIPKKINATWLSSSEFLSTTIFCIFVGWSFFIDSSSSSLQVLISAIFFLSLTILLYLHANTSKRSGGIKLKTLLFWGLGVIFFVIGSFLALGMAKLKYDDTVALTEEVRRAQIENIKNSVKEALLQGAFVEAIARAKSIEKDENVSCIEIFYSGNKILDCNSENLSEGKLFKISSNMTIGGSNSPLGSIVAYYDNSRILRFAQKSFLFTLSVLGGVFALTALCFYFLIIFLLKDLSMLIRLKTEDPNSKFHSVIQEVQAIGDKFLSLKKMEIENSVLGAVQRNSHQVSHDIRAPLAALKYLISPNSTVKDEFQDILTHSVSRIENILNTLTLSKDSHEYENSNTLIDLPQIIEEIIREKSILFKNINFTFKDRTGGSPRVFINVTEFERAISNLLNNAVEAKYKNESFIDVEVSEARNSKGKYIQIKIKDNGKGIAKEYLAEITKRGISIGKQNGKGLGLFHAESLFKGIGGNLFIESSEENGTLVTVDIPLK